MTNNKSNDFKQEIVSELALQLLPTVYDKAIHITESDRFFRYEDWRNDIVAESFKLAEQYKEQIDPRAYKALLNYKVSIDD